MSAVHHFKKLINSFHKDRPEKPIATFPPIDSAPPMARPTIKPTQPITKQKQDRLANSANKRAKKNWNSSRDKQPSFQLIEIFFFL